ncbi:MAG: membrane integrity-associated transporter subunit PqiC [Candidatus Cloacimonetes bacterium]|nr:membrane integrity-associated transporter subunit PqiC [Candidatus Cloacimonadota bacterium]
MKKILYLLPLLVILLWGCTAGEILSRNYYVLEYFQHSEKKSLFQEEPLPVTVLINDAKIPQTYNRRQIVIRHFGPKITYSEENLWGVRLPEIIANLVAKRFNRYNLFKQTQREFLKEIPEYEVNISVINIELYESEFIRQARLNIELTLSRSGEEEILVSVANNIEKTLPDINVETFVQSINDMIFAETDNFVRKILNYFIEDRISIEYLHDMEERYDSTLTEVFDEALVSEGKGLLLLPALTRSDNEPYYTIIDKYGYEMSGKIGTPIPLLPGTYSIHYGSGDDDQKIKKSGIEIVPRYKRIVEPDWGCLLVDVIDENRDFKKVRYELFDAENGESYGSEFPAEEEVGEQQKVWVLKPGLYKVTINNEPFNTYRDFTTVYVEEGKVQNLTIVVQTDEEGNPTCLAGAGVLEETSFDVEQGRFKLSSAIHGNVNINSDNETDEDNPETTITLNSQLDNHLMYDADPLHYSMKNLIEVGTSKSEDTDFRVSSDEFDIKNTLIYYFIRNLGFYCRFDANSHFFEEKYHSASNFYYTKINTDGEIIEEDQLDDEVIIKPSIYPLVLKEGFGVNYRLLNFSRATLSLRAGFGLRQDFNRDVFVLTGIEIDEEEDIEYRTYMEEESTDTRGTEVSLVGNFQLPFGITYTTNADFLFPFKKEDITTLEWENIVNLRLFKYISLDYKLKLENKKPEVGDEYIVKKHSLFLRITYILR